MTRVTEGTRVTELTADKERLDLYEVYAPLFGFSSRNGAIVWFVYGVRGQHASLRAAIDAVLAAKKTKEENECKVK